MNMVAWMLLGLLSLNVFAGGANGGGTDHLPDDFGVAWFLNDVPARHVKVCVQHDAEKFPMAAELIKAPFMEAVQQWATYINKHEIYESDIDPDDEEENIEPEKLQLVTDFRFVSDCKTADLTIYLGVENKEINDIRNTMFDPYAFVHRSSYDKKQGWGKGMIWLKGYDENQQFFWDKNENLNLKGVLLHELGHIFGNEHLDGTIMAADFGEELYAFDIPEDSDFAWKWLRFHMTNIDWNNEIVQQLTSGKFPEGGMYAPGTRSERESFKFATGKAQVGTPRSKMTFDLQRPEDEYITGKLEVHDDVGSATHKLFLRVTSTNMVNGNRKIFARYRLAPDADDERSVYSYNITSDNQVVSVMGHIAMGAKNVPVILEGIAAEFDIGQYPEDRRENALAQRRFPYRLIALDGTKRHFLYASYEWLNFDSERKPESVKKFLKH